MEKKKLVIAGVIILLVLGVGFFMLTGSRKNQTKINTAAFPTEAVIPTVDSSVVVEFVPTAGGHEVALSVKKLPGSTNAVDYELSYQTSSQGLQGVIGTVTLKGGEDSIEKQITLGTCSSGKCVYHQVVGKIKLTLKFNGSYGEKIFEKEYSI